MTITAVAIAAACGMAAALTGLALAYTQNAQRTSKREAWRCAVRTAVGAGLLIGVLAADVAGIVLH